MRVVISIIAVAVVWFSCGEDNASPEDCTEAYCPFIGNWSLQELYADGDPVTDDFSAYRIELKQPGSGSQTGAYQRTLSGGEQESGTWSVANNNDVILLNTPDGTESYLVESVGSTSLILVMERENTKPGPGEFRFVLKK